MKALDQIKLKYQLYANTLNCRAGRHRWTVVLQKLKDGSATKTRVCQSCQLHEPATGG
jgi:hypothetical protein